MKYRPLLFFFVFLSGIIGVSSATEVVTNSLGDLSVMIPHVTSVSTGSTAMQGSPHWVAQGGDGRLIYGTNNLGDRIPDFSNAGYGGGGVKIPDVPVIKKLAPSTGDDSAAIQAAVDAVGAMPLKDGFRGAVLLSPGTFHCSNTITLSQDGIVLRGSGTNENTGTVINMTGSAHVCLNVSGRDKNFKDVSAPAVPIIDFYVPCGETNLTVTDASKFQTGDAVIIRRILTKEWIHFMGMDTLVRDGMHQTWIKEGSVDSYERNILAIKGNRLTLDLPFPDAIDGRFLTAASATVIAKFTDTDRINHCGLESLRINSPPPIGNLTASNNTAVSLIRCQDCWVKDLFMQDTLKNVKIDGGCRRITIDGLTCIHATKLEAGKGAAGNFNIMGSQVLLNHCTCSGNGSFFVTTLDRKSTLNVVLNCTFLGKGGIQPHMRWSTALLLDNCNLPDGKIAYHNRGTCGSGQGWAMGWGVIWNCKALMFLIQQPPGSINWCIGCAGDVREKRGKGKYALKGSWLESRDFPVVPKSLYLAQLRERLGDQALRNIGY